MDGEIRDLNEKSLEIVMFDLNKNTMQQFFASNYDKGKAELTDYIMRISGIRDLIPKDAIIDGYLFEPCGYSVNAIKGTKYWTIHITPEHDNSFVSFETNIYYKDYYGLVKKVLTVFKPARFSVAVQANQNQSNIFKWKFNEFTRLKSDSSFELNKKHYVFSSTWGLDMVFNWKQNRLVSCDNELCVAALSRTKNSDNADKHKELYSLSPMTLSILNQGGKFRFPNPLVPAVKE